MSPRRLFGWEPRTSTVFRYDAAGQVAETVTTTEPEFDPYSRALLLARLRSRKGLNEFGIPMSVATDPKMEHKFKVPAIPTVDHAVRAVALAQKNYYDQYDTKENPVNRAGHLWSVAMPDPE